MPSIDTIDEMDEVVNAFLNDPSARYWLPIACGIGGSCLGVVTGLCGSAARHVERAKEVERKYRNDAKAPMQLGCAQYGWSSQFNVETPSKATSDFEVCENHGEVSGSGIQLCRR